MKRMILFLSPLCCGLLALALLTGCATSGGEMGVFVGQPSSELLARLGPPTLRIPEGQGGQIWTYVDQSAAMRPVRTSGPGGINGAGDRAGPGSQASAALDGPGFTSRREFFIDASGTIYKFRSKGY